MNELKSDVAELKRSVRDRKEGERDNQQAPSPTPEIEYGNRKPCLLYTSPSPRDRG